MSNLLKDIYSPQFYKQFAQIVSEVLPSFDADLFARMIFVEDWNDKELKDRMKHTSAVLNRFFPKEFETTAQIIEEIVNKLRTNGIKEKGIEFMFLPDYIETFGIDYFEDSVKTMEFLTQFTSCEFAVRPFIIRYGERMLKQMFEWSKHENHHVRRLASEGSRPRLPWAMAIPELKKNPEPILPILENLKNDDSEYVRRSVANSLNDISKDNPEILVSIVHRWKSLSKNTDGILKHAARTLLKQGHSEILEHFGYRNSSEIRLSDFQVLNPKVKIGESLEFSFSVQNNSQQSELVRLEYGIFYLRQNGTLSKKVFKISERVFQPDEKATICRKQSFRIITTRKFYAGQHLLSIIINGRELLKTEFELLGIEE
jgi:3-methyladenine DNA glycosylase AlkC